MDGGSQPFYNDGLLVLNSALPAEGPRTLIVSGIARSGTSMVAQALVTAGVFMGSDLDDVVFEDAEMAAALGALGRSALDGLVSRRNSRADVWGFKRPHIFSQRGPEVESAFRNPRFILTYRDPIAIAKRNGISELFHEAGSLRDAAGDIQRCVGFALGLTCPTLLVSYEKALQQPEAFADRLLGFCGLTVTPSCRARIAGSIDGSRQEYLNAARRRFEGHVDRIEHGVVHGWCRQVGVNEPVLLDVTVGDGPAVAVHADQLRPDLAGAGFAFLQHGFKADVSQLVRTGAEAVTVRVRDRTFELSGSGKTVVELMSRR